MKKKGRILFYSSVKDKEEFKIQKFYEYDIRILEALGYQVSLSNRIKDFLKFWQYDKAFLYFYRYSLFPAIIAKLFGKENYFTGGIDALSGFGAKKGYLRQKVLFKMCYVFADVCILVSNNDRQNVMHIYGGKLPRKCTLSYHVLDVEAFEYRGEQKEDIATTIAWMGAIANVKRKGVDKTIRAFSRLVQTYPSYRLMIAGMPGEGLDYLRNIVDQCHCQEHVIFLGSISEEEKIQLLKRSKIYSQLSVYEGFGLAATEALAAGNIVVNSGRGGLADAVGENGIVVDIENENQIYDGFVQALARAGEQSYIRQGIAYVKQNFSYQRRLEDFRILIK